MEEQQPQPLTKYEQHQLRKQEKTRTEQRQKLKRLYGRIALWVLVALIVGGGLFGVIKIASQLPQSKESAVSPISKEDWTEGSASAKVALIEYSDFQCPTCAFYHPLLKKLTKEFENELIIAYRHFPLPGHKNSKAAAYAAEAAGKQGKFWQMHDLIFKNQGDWKDKGNPEEFFSNYANSLSLDISQFKVDFASKEIKEKVEESYNSSIELGLNSTPTFFLNGRKISNPRNYDEFKNIIAGKIDESN